MTTLVHDINTRITQAMTRRGLDPRFCHTGVVAVPPAGHELVVESSDAGLLDDLRGMPGAEGKVRWVALPGEGAGLPAGQIAASSVVDVRREPAHTSELRTQIVYGDAVEPLKDEGEWMLVRLDDGYVGWIRNWHLAALPAPGYGAWLDQASFRVATNHAEVLEAPQTRALPVSDLVIGTRVHITTCGKRGWRAVGLPDGREGFIQTRGIERLPRRRSVSRERLAATGLRFLGIPYIWGGTTPKGFDCSGLIQRIFRLNGRPCPATPICRAASDASGSPTPLRSPPAISSFSARTTTTSPTWPWYCRMGFSCMPTARSGWDPWTPDTLSMSPSWTRFSVFPATP